MTHLAQAAADRPPTTLSRAQPATITSLGIDRSRLHDAIAGRRAEISRIETEWAAACERNASRNAARGVRLEDRATWDRAMWQRYLAAAADNQANYMPRLRRLYSEVSRLEQLQTPLPEISRRAA